jgi:hypothetical protein
MRAPDVGERDGRDARGAVGVDLGDSCSLLVGLGLVVDRSRVEEAQSGSSRRSSTVIE